MNVVRLLQKHEGYSRKPYQCTAGRTTIGYGRNLDDQGIDAEEAEYLLRRDIARAGADLQREPYWDDLGEVRQAVLLDMVVNLGWPRFALFRGMRAALGRGDYAQAALEMRDSRWYTQVGARARRLIGMMESGQWPADL